MDTTTTLSNLCHHSIFKLAGGKVIDEFFVHAARVVALDLAGIPAEKILELKKFRIISPQAKKNLRCFQVGTRAIEFTF